MGWRSASATSTSAASRSPAKRARSAASRCFWPVRSAASANPWRRSARSLQKRHGQAGVDLLVLETFSSPIELREAVLAARSVSADLPISAQVSVHEEGKTLAGATPAEIVALLDALRVDALGVNCGVGPQTALDAIQQMRPLTRTPLSAMPNAGHPTTQGGRQIYVSTPEYFADYARRFAEAGVSIIGGCCGTTPEHIAAMRSALPRNGAASVTIVESTDRSQARVDEPPLSLEAPRAETSSPLARKVRAGELIISVEVDPPRGINPNKMLQGATLLKNAGVDCVDIGDSPMARVRMSCIAFAALCEQRVGVETLIHFTTRDRNLMALQSELLGAHALGIRNVIALTGDPPQMGSYRDRRVGRQVARLHPHHQAAEPGR
ncbi:MAG: hypothetical protein E6I75_24965 [Chloroflexi bacterium]|nr:MAG: hypothetical protein E6I75_24965 [Chloroflexota bacterium]